MLRILSIKTLKYKMPTNIPIKPIKNRCRCGKRVTDHHFLCNKCWGKSAKARFYRNQHKLFKQDAESVKNELRHLAKFTSTE